MTKYPKDEYDPLLLVANTCDLLRRIGFERVTVSMKTEAVYFRWPGRPGVLRVASHKSKQKMIGMDHVIAQIVFAPAHPYGVKGVLWCSAEAIKNQVAQRIGAYMVKSIEPLPPRRYRGKKGTWTKTHDHVAADPNTP